MPRPGSRVSARARSRMVTAVGTGMVKPGSASSFAVKGMPASRSDSGTFQRFASFRTCKKWEAGRLCSDEGSGILFEAEISALPPTAPSAEGAWRTRPGRAARAASQDRHIRGARPGVNASVPPENPMATTAHIDFAPPKAAIHSKLAKPPSKVAMRVFGAILLAGLVYSGMQLVSDVSQVHTGSILPFLLLGVALLIALGFEFVNGFHDTANAVAT